MRRYFIITFILAAISAVFGGCCFGAQVGAESLLSTGEYIESRITYPWTTFALLSTGMAFIVIQNIESKVRNYAGTIGALLVGLTFAMYISAGMGSLMALMLLMAGVALIIIEARVLPGHGISAIVGIICEFAGVYLILGGAENGVFFPATMALMVSILSALAFFAYISGNSTWKSMLRNIEMERSQSGTAIDIDTSAVKIHNTRGISNRSECGTVQIATQVGRISTQTPVDNSQQNEHVQTSQPDPVRQLNNLKMMQAEVETCALPVLTDQHRAEHDLQKAKEYLAGLQNEARSAAALGNDGLAKEILMRADVCRSKVDEISAKLSKLKAHSDAAREHIREFEEELHKAETHSEDNSVKMQIAAMRTMLLRTLDESIRVIESLEDRADQICAEADAMTDINAVAGRNQQQQIDELNARRQRAEQALAEMKSKLGRQTSDHQSASSQPSDQDPNQRIINKD